MKDTAHNLLGQVKLLVLDLDGTALGGTRPYAKFTKKFCKFLDGISEHGCLWCINTTWDIDGQWDLILNSPVKSRPIFLMGELGYSLAKVENNEPVVIQEYSKLLGNRVKHCNEKYIYPLISKIVNKFYPERMYFYGHLFSFIPKEKSKNFQSYIKENFSKIPKVKIYCTEGGMTVHPSFLNKGNVLAEAEKILRVAPEEVIIAGDSMYDLPMMRPTLGRYLICPSNADDAVKKVVVENHGVVASKPFSEGVIEGFHKLDKCR